MSKGLSPYRNFKGIRYTLHKVYRADQTPAINREKQDALNLENEMRMTIERQDLLDLGMSVRKIKRSNEEYALYIREPEVTKA